MFVDDVICVLCPSVVERKVVNSLWEEGIIHLVVDLATSLKFVFLSFDRGTIATSSIFEQMP